jgi:hypothetical protein
MKTTVEKESLHNILRNILEEARMILPGTQTLFGFQIIVVFTEYFHNELMEIEKTLHFTSMLLTLISFTIILSLTAYHRQIPIDFISRKFVSFGGQLLKIGMFPLMIAISIEFYLVGLQIFKDNLVAIAWSIITLLFLLLMWYLIPRITSKTFTI